MSAADIDSRIETFRERVVGRAIKESSFTDYERWIRRFEGWKATRGVGDPDIGTLEAFDNFLEDGTRIDYPWENGRGRPAPDSYSYSSRKNAASAVKMWVRREYGVRIPETPDEICYGEPDPFDPVYMDPETVQQAIASARDDCDLHGCGVALRLSYDAVMRASELVQVRRRDIDISSATVYVQATKGSQNADVGLDRATVDRLERFLDPEDAGGPLFENSYGRPWSATAWASHVLRNHVPEGSHAFGRHAPVMHRLEGADPGFMDASFETEDFGDVFRRARHTNPGQTAEYARVVGVSVPEWADGD